MCVISVSEAPSKPVLLPSASCPLVSEFSHTVAAENNTYKFQSYLKYFFTFSPPKVSTLVSRRHRASKTRVWWAPTRLLTGGASLAKCRDKWAIRRWRSTSRLWPKVTSVVRRDVILRTSLIVFAVCLSCRFSAADLEHVSERLRGMSFEGELQRPKTAPSGQRRRMFGLKEAERPHTSRTSAAAMVRDWINFWF